jgi:hypothetical protein
MRLLILADGESEERGSSSSDFLNEQEDAKPD